MPTINGKVCVVNGKPVDKVFSDGQQVYGRNLYTDTQNFNNPTSWTNFSNWIKTTNTYKGLTVMQTGGDWWGLCQFIPVKKGDILTYSAYVRYISGTGTSQIYWSLNSQTEDHYWAATLNIYQKPIPLTDSWQKVSSTTIATSDGYIRPRIERTNNNTNTLQIAGIKLEKGSVVTPWTPAPEDVGVVAQST